MKIKCIFYLILCICSTSAFAQPELTFDSASYDLGMLKEGRNILAQLHFKNTGNEPLIFYSARASDPAGIFHVPTEPVMPGDTSHLLFTYDSHRIGNFRRAISITSNARKGDTAHEARYNSILIVKGQVVPLQTKICAETLDKDVGAIDFRHTASVQFLLVNCGSDDLETHSSLHGLGEDVVSATIEDISYNSYDKQYDRTHNPPGGKLRLLPLKMDDMVKCPPGDTLLLGMDLSNMYGRTGRFAKDIALPYNHGRDTLHLTVKGVYTGNANNDSIVEDLVTSFYKNGVLIKKIQRSSTGHILYEKFYDGGYCIQQNEYSYNGKISKELFYTKGTLSMGRYYNLNGEFNRQTYYENGYGYRTINTKE